MELITTPATTQPLLEPGCHFDSARGYHNNAKRVIDLANAYGANIVQTDRESDIIEPEMEATAYLEQFAPEGHYVGWYDGDWGVWPIEED